jgi:hypothetical protein
MFKRFTDRARRAAVAQATKNKLPDLGVAP